MREGGSEREQDIINKERCLGRGLEGGGGVGIKGGIKI